MVLTTSNSSIPKEVIEELGEIDSWLPLIVTIVYEILRKDQSPWYPYINVLPTTFPPLNTLMFWNKQELAELQGSAVVNKVGKEDAEEAWQETIIPLMLKHSRLFPVEGAAERAKRDELIKLAHIAGSLIMAYAFDIDTDDDRKEPETFYSGEHAEDDFTPDEPLKGMVPFADMLNADAERNNVRLQLMLGIKLQR